MSLFTLKDVERVKLAYEKMPQYPLPKWLLFCEELINEDWEVRVEEAKSTVSKYIYVRKGKLRFKIRFSNHKPNRTRQLVEEDCDFYVGISHNGVITTEKLLEKLKGMVEVHG